MRCSRALVVVSSLLTLPAAIACKCESSFGTCSEVQHSNLVFIGTVESLSPPMLSRWNAANRAVMGTLNGEWTRVQQHPTPEGIAHLKEMYARLFPDLPFAAKHDLEVANSVPELVSFFEGALGRGMKVHFKVKTVYRNHGDDDKKDDDDDVKAASFDIWTPFNDCGFDFQPGETYLVFANSDEGDETFFTSKCTHTSRLSDAGADLAYLSFYKDGGPNAGRVTAFLTSDRRNQLGHDRLHERASVSSPLAGAVAELRGGTNLVRYAEADSGGAVVFDGLAEGDYRLSVYAPGYPRTGTEPLAAPFTVHMEQRGCANPIVVLPAPTLRVPGAPQPAAP